MPLKTHLDETPALNLTPMIDIVFLLIIFFMVGTRFAELERTIALRVPKVSDAGPLAPAPQKRVINVYRDGRLELDQQPMTVEQLKSHLAEALRQYEDLGVIVRGDGDGPFKNVASVLGACRTAGIADMAITVRLDYKRR